MIAKKGDSIFDSHLGSGSIAFICEHEKGYYSGYCEWKNIRSDKNLEILKREVKSKKG